MKAIEDKRVTTPAAWRGKPREIEVEAKKPFLLSEAWDCDTPARWLVSMGIAYGGAVVGLVVVLSAGAMPELLRQALFVPVALCIFSLTFCWVFRRPVGLYWIAALVEQAFAGRALSARSSER